jgi:trypsin-like peptidase
VNLGANQLHVVIKKEGQCFRERCKYAARWQLWQFLLCWSSAALSGAGLSLWAKHGVSQSQLPAVVVAAEKKVEAVPPNALGFAPVLKPALAAVVNISSSRTVKTPHAPFSPFFEDPFFRQFFGDQFFRQMPREQREHSLGSGVIVTEDGYILTNNHVVDKATDIKVALPDKREFKGKVVGSDPKTDVAVVKISASSLPTLSFGDSDKLQVGDYVLPSVIRLGLVKRQRWEDDLPEEVTLEIHKGDLVRAVDLAIEKAVPREKVRELQLRAIRQFIEQHNFEGAKELVSSYGLNDDEVRTILQKILENPRSHTDSMTWFNRKKGT